MKSSFPISRQLIEEALKSLIKEIDNCEIPDRDEVFLKLVEDQTDQVCAEIRRVMMDKLPPLGSVHFIRDYKIEVPYRDDIHQQVKQRVIARLKTAGWDNVVIHDYHNGLTKIHIFIESVPVEPADAPA